MPGADHGGATGRRGTQMSKGGQQRLAGLALEIPSHGSRLALTVRWDLPRDLPGSQKSGRAALDGTARLTESDESLFLATAVETRGRSDGGPRSGRTLRTS
jgi:hypothetical protein